MWLSELKLISILKIPRCYSVNLKLDGSNQLHVFCDASEQAYCVVAYLRSSTPGGVETAFISSKTHVAPLKSTSIPRLELQMGNLPKCRLQPYMYPFLKNGVDYLGPMEVTVRRSREKRCGVIFTCMSTRAIHLDLAGSLSTDSCIMAIRRLISRRGQPLELYPDNGTNFKGADAEMKKSIADQ
jgi:hypothetical protein